MTQILIASLALTLQVQGFPNRPPWAHTLLDTQPMPIQQQSASSPTSIPAKNYRKAANPSVAALLKLEGGGPGPKVGDAERGALFDKALRYGGSLLRLGKVQGALDYFIEAAQEPLQLQGLLRTSEYLDLLLLLGRNTEAEPLLASFVNDRGSDSEEMYLRLSLLAAAKGRVVRGQDEYVRQYIADTIKWNEPKSSKLLPAARPMDAKAVLVDSCLALGLKGRPAYHEMALRLDPANAFAATRLMSYYEAKQRYSEARRVGNSVLAKLAPGPKRDTLAKQLKWSQGRPDTPIDPVIPKPQLGPPPP